MTVWKRLVRTVTSAVPVVVLACVISLLVGYQKASALTFLVSGTVTNASTSAPLPSTTVQVYSPGTNTLRYAAVSTGSNGTYSINVEPGTYDFRFVPLASTGLNSPVERNVTVGGNLTLDKQITNAKNIFSGVLTDQSGKAIPNIAVNLRDLYGYSVSGTTTSTGSFSLAVQPGIYSLKVYGFMTGLGNFTLEQAFTAPSIDLTGGDLAKNLQLQLAAVNYTAYNAQGYKENGARVNNIMNGTFSGVSLYPGDSGYFVSYNTLVATGSQGSLKAVVGVTYPSDSLCVRNSSNQLIGCRTTPLDIPSLGSYVIDLPQTPAAPYIFSGTLTTSDGTPISAPSTSVQLRDAFGNIVGGGITTGGNFSLSVQPGVYSLRVSSYINGLGTFILEQNVATPTIDMTGANVTQNLVIPLATVNFTAYNAQGYKLGGARVDNRISGTFSPVSLYPGDPGYWTNFGVVNTANSQGVGNFRSIVGVTYDGGTNQNYICVRDGSNQLIGCRATPLAITNTAYTVDLPQTPAPARTFSGALTGNGTPLNNFTVTLRDAFNNSVSTTTNTSGNFSLSVQPGTYALEVSGSTSSYGVVISLKQNSATPTIDLTSSNVVQNLQIEFGKVDYRTYNAQGYAQSALVVQRFVDNNAIVPVSLYSGDPGYRVSIIGNNTTSNSQGIGSFYSIVGVTYPGSVTQTNNQYICDFSSGGSVFFGCVATPFTVTSGTNALDIPKTPAAPVTFSGVLMTSENVVIPNASVQLHDTYGTIRSATTSSNGSFSVTVQPGMYALTVNGSIGGSYTGFSFTFAQNPTSPTLDLTAGNVVRDLVLPVATVNFITNTTTATPLPYARVNAVINNGSFAVPLYAGDSTMYTVTLGAYPLSNAQAVGSFKGIVGVTYGTTTSNGICEYTSGSVFVACISTPFTVVDGFNNLVIPQTPPTGPAAPTGLNAVSPTTLPVLNWQAVSGAFQYRVYRNGTLVAMTGATSFTDNNLPSGTYSYYVTAVASNGGESVPSDVISVTVEAVPPTLNTPILSPNEITVGQDTNLSVQVSGSLAGFLGGEYFIGADPGEGNGTGMSFAGSTLNATISGLLPGNYTINVRAHNGAGWSAVVSATLKVATLAPTNLAGESPTHLVVLTWDSVEYASGYDIYRNGGKIATSATNTYTDTTAPVATNSYFIKALNADGFASAPSSTIEVTYAGPLHAITGQVTFDGVAAPGVLVDTNKVGGLSGFAITDETGTYNILNREDGDYSVTVSNPLNGTAVTSAGAPEHFKLTSGFPFVAVNGGDVIQNLAFDASAVTITVKNGQGLLLANSKVTLINTTDGLAYTTDGHVFNFAESDVYTAGFTGGAGTVVMYVFPGATYQICASFPQLNTMSSSQPYCAPLGLTVNGDLSYEFVLPSSYNLTGHVSFGGSAPATGGAKVIIRSSDGSIQQIVLSDANGDYAVGYLPNGVYDLEFDSNGAGGGAVPQNWHFVKSGAITVNGADVEQNLEFATNLVTVTVLDETGDIVNGALVTLKSKSGNPITTVDNSLTFDFAAETVVASGATSVGQTTLGVFPGESYQACALVGTVTYCNPTYLFVDANKSILVIAAETYVVTGTVLANGNPVAVTVLLTDQYTESDQTDASGAYTVGNLINGSYNTTVSHSGPSNSSMVTGLPDTFSLASAQRYVNVNGANATHNLAFTTYPVAVNVYDGSNSLLAGSTIMVTGGGGTVPTSDGLMSFILGSTQARGTSVTDGSPVLYLFAGTTYRFCAAVGVGTYCANYEVTPTSNNLVEIRIAAPLGLSVTPLTSQDPVLSWNAAPAAVSYNIYRDGLANLIGSSTATSFTDITAAEGYHTYYVQAVYPGDDLSDLSSPGFTTVDRTAPVLVSLAWTNNPSLFNHTVPSLTAQLSDNLTNIVGGEYFVGYTDPGIGQGVHMTPAAGMTLVAAYDWVNYPPGTYLITVRGQDSVGLWSNTLTTTLVVEHPAPTDVTADVLTYVPPVISWSPVPGSQSYTVYRNGTDVGSSLTTSFVDEGAVAGTNVYTIVAVSLLGIQSAHSEPFSVVYDPFPPTIEAEYHPEPSNGWNNSPVTLVFTCSSQYGVQACPGDVTVTLDGEAQEVTVTAIDVLGGSTTRTFYVDLDQTAPTIGEPTLSEDVLHPGQTTTLTVSASDGLSGVAGGEYFIGADPGVGSGAQMLWDGANLTASFGATLAPGVYTVSVRAMDVAGNWGNTAAVELTVVLNAPTNLAAASPTQAPVLTWTGSEGAVSYNIYRDSALVGNVVGTGFTDSNAPDGTRIYYVTAVDINDNESEASNTVSVLVNTVPPTTTASLSPSPYAQDGTYPDPVTVTLNASAVSGLSVTATYYTVDSGAQQTYLAPFTVSGAGNHTITYWSVDNAGVVEAAKTTTFTIHTNLAPVINPISGATINEGSSFSRSGSFSDFDSASWTATVDYGDGSGAQPLTLSGASFTLNHAYADDGTYTVTVVVTDNNGALSTVAATVIVNNVAPTAGDIMGIPIDPIEIDPSTGVAIVNGSITFADAGILDTHTAVWNWGDNTTSVGVVTEANGTGMATGGHNYTSPGIYLVTVTITDNGGLSVTKQFFYANIYDSASKFTAGVKFDSPQNALPANPNLTGQVMFHVNVNYDNSGQLTGTVSMMFAAASMNFSSTGLVMLVCTELGQATLTGSGSLNGVSGYTFWVTGIDKNQPNGNKIRFRITDSAGNVVYDTNVPDASNAYDPITAAPDTSVTSGSVIVK